MMQDHITSNFTNLQELTKSSHMQPIVWLHIRIF